LHLVKPIDAAALTAYCLTWQRLVDAQAIIAREGMLHVLPQGRVRHPAVTIVEAASKDLRTWCAEFGLTPAAEAKVSKDDGAATDLTDPF
jgi:P27 family predicted phage terminase small subunit